MTKEDIIDAGIEYTMMNNPMCIGGDAFYEIARQMNRNHSFEAGAEWMQKEFVKRACEVIHNMMVEDFEFCLDNNDYIMEEFCKSLKKYE